MACDLADSSIPLLQLCGILTLRSAVTLSYFPFVDRKSIFSPFSGVKRGGEWIGLFSADIVALLGD